MRMLMRFSISNFMSFGYKKDVDGNIIPEEFHLYAGRSEQYKERVLNHEGRKVLKFSSIYGANASGKSNLIKAIECGKNILTGTFEKVNYKEQYCRNRKENKELPTHFEYEFTIKDNAYAYGFTVNLAEEMVLSEWLYKLEGEKENVIYERIVEEQEYYFDENMFRLKEDVQQFHYFLQDSNRINTSLFLYEIYRRNIENPEFQIFKDVYEWFKRKLIVIYPETETPQSYFLFESENERLIQILDYLDTGITNYIMQPLNETAFREYFPKNELADAFLKISKKSNRRKVASVLKTGDTLIRIKYGEEKAEKIEKLMFKHGLDETAYEFGEESDGTRRLIELLAVILNDKEDMVFVVDELDRSFHPKMTIKFVETFLKLSKESNTQLIITTHESNLMDLKILRRDEIWLAERESDNTTTLFPFDKYKVRNDKVIDKDYLDGRYGAVPIFKDFDYIWGKE